MNPNKLSNKCLPFLIFLKGTLTRARTELNPEYLDLRPRAELNPEYWTPCTPLVSTFTLVSLQLITTVITSSSVELRDDASLDRAVARQAPPPIVRLSTSLLIITSSVLMAIPSSSLPCMWEPASICVPSSYCLPLHCAVLKYMLPLSYTDILY